jgi:hypothetical protein
MVLYYILQILCKTDLHLGREGGTFVAVGISIPYNHVFFPPLVSVGATGSCIPLKTIEVVG